MTNKKLRDYFKVQDARNCALIALEQALYGLNSGEIKLRIPKRRGLFRKIEHSPFHAIYEVFLQLGGVTRFFLPEENLSLYANEMCFMPIGLPHRERAEKYRSDFLNLLFMIRKDSIYYHFATEGKEHAPKGLMDSIGHYRDSGQLNSYCESIVKASENEAETSELVIKGLGMAFLGTLHGIIYRREAPVTGTGSESAKVRQCRDIVNIQLSQPDLNVRTIAGFMRCSADYLSHLFRKETGLSLVDYINKLRVELARELLQDENLNVSEIAWSCGYSDPGYFTRVFKKFTGRSPRHYRLDLKR